MGIALSTTGVTLYIDVLISSSGFVFQFAIGAILGCWVAQLVYMVILLHFPFFGERALTKKKTYFHVVSLVLIISLSLIGPVVALARFNYVTIRFPPFICLPSSQNWVFYSFGLPISIFTATGVILCILLIRAVHKVSVLTSIHTCTYLYALYSVFSNRLYVCLELTAWGGVV